MNTIILIIIYIVVLLIIGALIGWFLARWKLKNADKRLSKEMIKPENIDRIIKLQKEQAETDLKREVNQNERKRKLDREELRRRKQGTEDSADKLYDQRKTEIRRGLSDNETKQNGQSNRRTEEPESSDGENESEYNYAE